jgi:hypothetical protein
MCFEFLVIRYNIKFPGIEHNLISGFILLSHATDISGRSTGRISIWFRELVTTQHIFNFSSSDNPTCTYEKIDLVQTQETLEYENVLKFLSCWIQPELNDYI